MMLDRTSPPIVAKFEWRTRRSTAVTETGGRKLRLDLLLRPMPPALFLTMAIIVLVVGALYCSGYERLLTNRNNWPGSLIWAAYGLLPWLALFEYIKRFEWDADRPLPTAQVALLIIAGGVASVGAEFVHHQLLLGQPVSSIALQVLRRLPGVAAMVLLIGLSRREQERAQRRWGAPKAPESEIETLRRHAPAIRWIQAADNYLELHAEGQVWTSTNYDA